MKISYPRNILHSLSNYSPIIYYTAGNQYTFCLYGNMEGYDVQLFSILGDGTQLDLNHPDWEYLTMEIANCLGEKLIATYQYANEAE